MTVETGARDDVGSVQRGYDPPSHRRSGLRMCRVAFKVDRARLAHDLSMDRASVVEKVEKDDAAVTPATR